MFGLFKNNFDEFDEAGTTREIVTRMPMWIRASALSV